MDLVLTQLGEAHGKAWLDGFERELRLGYQLEKANYAVRQAKVREAQKALGPVKTSSALGRQIAAIDPRTYFRWIETDPYFWRDKKNVRRFIADNPEVRV